MSDRVRTVVDRTGLERSSEIEDAVFFESLRNDFSSGIGGNLS